MGNKVSTPVSFDEFPKEYIKEHIPEIGHIITVTPGFRCSPFSGIEAAGRQFTAKVNKLNYLCTAENKLDIKPHDWKIEIEAIVLEPSSVIPYCSHAHGVLDINIGQNVFLHHDDDCIVGNNIKGFYLIVSVR